MITEKEFDSILLKFLLDEPFFATIVRHMTKVCEPSVGTAGVTYNDGVMTLLWAPEFVSSLERKKIFGLLKHECYHLILKHVTTRKQEPHTLWNIATDCAINSMIPKQQLPECGLIPGVYRDLETREGVEIDKERKNQIEKFRDYIANLPPGKSSEWYMEDLKNNEEISQIVEDLYASKVLVVMDEHDESNLSEADKIIADQKVKEIIKKAKEVGNTRGWGSVSYSIRNEIEKMTTDKFDWERSLRYFCGNKLRSNTFNTQRKINRKYPYIHPGRKVKKTSMLAVYIDQSGSVGADSLARFGSLLEKLSKTHTFVYYYFDSAVDENSKTTWRKGKASQLKRRLTGGTSFDAVENHFRKIKKDFDGCIVMTDGYALKPKPCTSKRCWVICPNGSLQFTPDKKDFVVKMRPDNI